MRCFVTALLCFTAACGQPEDLLRFTGRVTDADGGTLPPGVELTLYRDLGAGELGCSEFSPWRTVTPGDAGTFTVEFLRQETTGRFGSPRCVRLEWRARSGVATTRLSWLSRARNTTLPPLLAWQDVNDRRGTWYDALEQWPAPPSMTTDLGSVTTRSLSLEVADTRGVVFRQPLLSSPPSLLGGAGPAPADGSRVTARQIQRGQQTQPTDLGEDPYLQFEFRAELSAEPFSGDSTWRELARGRPCNVGGAVCPFTDGLYVPVDLPAETPSLDVQLGQPVSTVVLRGLGSSGAYSAVVLEAVSNGVAVEGARALIDPLTVSLSTASIEDVRLGGYLVLKWSGTFEPVDVLRVRLIDPDGANVPIGWLSELSVY